MAGKPYSMREMKGIVDYLVEHKAYKETKGRKMWMDFANSKLTNRTWQSLKETFLKRILPDIHNPYYKLTVEQIASIKNGYDVVARMNSKLEIRSISVDSNTDDKEHEKPSTTKEDNQNPGEDITCSKSHHRASVETLILDEDDKGYTSLRDLITYTDPLTPMLREVVNDFSTDDEDDLQPQMQIVEDEIHTDNDNENNTSKDKVDPSPSILNNEKQDKSNNDENKTKNEDNIDSVGSICPLNGHKSPVKDTVEVVEDPVSIENIHTENSSLRVSNATVDTQLPNNQEQLPNNQEKLPPNNDEKQTEKAESSSKPMSKEQKTSKRKTAKEARKLKNVNSKNEDDDCIEISENPEVPDVSDKVQNEDINGDEETNKNVASDLTYDVINSEDITKSQKINPCLQSVSLYAEQFSSRKYSDSDSNVNEAKETEEPTENPKHVEKKTNGPVILKSHSENDSKSSSVSVSNNKSHLRPGNTDRDKVLANIFGFSSGNVAPSRKRKNSHGRKSHNFVHHLISESSEWTSDSEEYVSPPRSKKYKKIKKIAKPKSVRIHSLEEEGGLFVMHGKKIYPLIKDGKILKNYLTYLSESDSDEERNNYWKTKYVELQMKTSELAKKLDQVENGSAMNRQSPILQTKRLSSNKPLVVEDDGQENVPVEIKKNDDSKENKTVKIKFTENNKEWQLEGNWQHLHPVLEQVVSIFNKESDNDGKEKTDLQGDVEKNKTKKEGKKLTAKNSENCAKISVSSRSNTPLNENPDPDVQKKIDDLEKEIFSEIEDLVMVEEEETKEVDNKSGKNITTRKKRNLSLKSDSPAKKKKVNALTSAQTLEIVQDTSKSPEAANKTMSPRKSRSSRLNSPKPSSSTENVSLRKSGLRSPDKNITRQSRKTKSPSVQKPNEIIPAKRGRPSKGKVSLSKITTNTGSLKKSETGINIKKSPLKKTPSIPPTSSPPRKNKSTLKSKDTVGVKKDVKTKQKTSTKIRKAKKSDASSSSNESILSESTQGYQDSDDTVFEGIRRKKKRVSVSAVWYKGRNQYLKNRRRSIINGDDASSESSNMSCYLTANTARNSSNTEPYRSDSYQLLFPKTKTTFGILEKIEEVNPKETENKANVEKSLSSDNVYIDVAVANSSQGNSSVVSPEISIVEKLSLSKSDYSNGEFPVPGEINNIEQHNKNLNEFLLSDVDITIPLMGQDCEIQKQVSQFRTFQEADLLITDVTMKNLPKRTLMSESLINQIGKVNIDNSKSLSDSINCKLNELLLDSAKKISVQGKSNVTNENDAPQNSRKVNRKSCSTPIKKKPSKKLKSKNLKPVIDEHMESYSHEGRRSCPPVIQIISNENNVIDSFEHSNFALNDTDSSVADITKGRKKKNVIKVKILKPKNKQKDKKSSNETSKIINDDAETNFKTHENESGIFLKSINDSVDFIHNHSETCLQAHDCVGNSIEIQEKSRNSIITLDSVCNSMDLTNKSTFSGSIKIASSSDLLCDNAQDCLAFYEATTLPIQEDFETGENIVTPHFLNSFNSLLTEDLSDELLVEPRESTSTACTSNPPISTETKIAGYGSNLHQIFPITCAVPDLSTITEQDENSRKTRTEANSNNKNIVISQSSFNFNSTL